MKSPTSFPPTVPCSDNQPVDACVAGNLTSLAPTGPLDRFPALIATTSCSDFLPTVLPRFVSFVWQYRPVLDCSSLPGMSTPLLRAGVLWIVASPTTALTTESAGSPRFLVSPHTLMPCSLTPVGPPRQTIAALRCCLPLLPRRRLPRCLYFGAPSHGLLASCVRFAESVSLPHATLGSGCWSALPDGVGYPLGTNVRFQLPSSSILLTQALPGARKFKTPICRRSIPTLP